MKAAGYDYDTSGEFLFMERLDIPIYLPWREIPCC
jgi:hypothetical protein